MAIELRPDQAAIAKLAGSASGQLPMTEAKMIQLLQHLQQQDLHSSDGSASLTKDGFAFCLT